MHEMEKRFGMGLYELQADGAAQIGNVTV
jgi:hypothetical protein